MSQKYEYVCGFLFNPDTTSVVLIRKNRPAWQAGKLNGVGGKIEEGETPSEAMCREFVEETGLFIQESAWRHYVSCNGLDYVVHFFVGFGSVEDAQTVTDEAVEIVSYPDILSSWSPDKKDGLIHNLSWLLPLALQSAQYETIEIRDKT